ncbi:phasin family protein [Ruminiclostridium herbifermentans]|uniref:Phasin family protein n=1 Tax=Ruminiclostridium herbifermentans TaxID=2488810 RepID=A0A7H1VTK8_9FIRM|nr:phasin family protein [Ruminiclostridium herbifermentans]
MNNISDDLKKIILAGIGAVATTAEKSKQVLDELVKKGEITVEQGKVLNEELKRNINSKIKVPFSTCDTQEAAKVNVDSSEINTSDKNVMSITKQLDKLSKEEIAAIKAKLAELERTDTDGETGE